MIDAKARLALVLPCEICRRLGEPKSADYTKQVMKRTLEIIRLWDGIAREKKPDNLWQRIFRRGKTNTNKTNTSKTNTKK